MAKSYFQFQKRQKELAKKKKKEEKRQRKLEAKLAGTQAPENDPTASTEDPASNQVPEQGNDNDETE
jgi:hypothetical protein